MLLGLFLMFATPAEARDVCRNAVTTTDALTGESATTLVRGGFILSVEGEAVTVTMPVRRVGQRPAPIPEGTEVMLALENGTRVHFYTKGVPIPGADAVTQYAVDAFTMTWALSPEAAHAAAQSRPIAMRYTLGGVEAKPDYAKGTGRLLQSFYACAAERMPIE